MAEIFFNIREGSGTARVDVPPPYVQGERFTMYFTPDPGQYLLAVRAFDSYDYSVALPPVVNNQITMIWQSAWNNLYVNIYFYDGEPGPGPGPGPTPKANPLWLLFLKRNKRRRIVNY